jgi:creatinine amidohydrolase
MARLLEELGWPDVEAYLQDDDRLMLVVGSTEQHGRHMVFASDVWQPWEIARRLSERTGVLLAPPLNYGMSMHHLGFPGSLTLRPQTLSAMFVDILESACGHGFRHILVLNGHGGNTASIHVALAEVLNNYLDLQVLAAEWWREPEVLAAVDEVFPGETGGHADAVETSLVMAIRPDVVRLDRAEYSPGSPHPDFLTRKVFQEHFPHGVIGLDPRQASAGAGERILTAAVEVYERVLQAWGPRS